MIETRPAPWSEDVTQVFEDGHYLGEVRKSDGDFICLQAVERAGQRLPLDIGRVGSVEAGAELVAEAQKEAR